MVPEHRVPTSTVDPSGSPVGAVAAGGHFWLTLLLVAICQLADLITFNVAVKIFGPSGELGPLGVLYRMGGFWGVAVVKLGIIAVVMVVLTRFPWQRLVTRRRIALFAAGVGVAGAFTNVLAFSFLL